MKDTAGELEQMILFAILALGENAYGAEIRREIESRTGRDIAAGAIYTVLERLENQSLVSSWVGEPTAERGGRRRKYYCLEQVGAEVLQRSYDQLHRMSEGLLPQLVDARGNSQTS